MYVYMHSIIDGLNPKQLQAVTSMNGPMMIIAGAGSGKTRVITLKIANLVQNNIPTSQILALTFSNKAATEMQERMKKYCSDTQPIISTFHSFGYYLISRFAKKLSLPKKITIYNTNDQIQVIKELLKQKSYPTLFNNQKNEVNPYVQQQHISLLKNNLLPEIYTNPDIYRLRKNYDETLRVYHALDFDDLILKPLELLNNPSVLNTLHNQFSYFLIDEFQDTSTLQFEIMQKIAQYSQNICVVGDDDQSIYSWRGADLQNWNRFANAFPSHSEIILDTSYRCSPIILRAANSVVSSGKQMRQKTLVSHKNNIQEYPIHIFSFFDEQQEAENITDMVSTYHYQYDIPWSEIGILTRTNSLFTPFEMVLNQVKIPYIVSGGSSFFDHIEIKDLISYLRIINNHNDNISCRRIINTPRRGLGTTGINYLSEYAELHTISIFESCVLCGSGAIPQIPKATQLNCYDFTQIILNCSKKLTGGLALSACLKDLIAYTNYHQYINESFINQPKILSWKEDNITRLIEIIEHYESKRLSSNDILNALAYKMIQDTKESDDAIELMTIHSAKGLEKEVIFIVGMEAGIMPHDKSIQETPEQIHEETRLCYVAITRAKTHLTLSWSQNRKNKRTQKYSPQSPSPYLECIPKDIITHDFLKDDKDKFTNELEKLSLMIHN